MRIFFDQNVPRNLRQFLLNHVVITAAEMGWSDLENGTLLKAVEEDGFELFITGDNNLIYQQNLSDRKLAILALTRNNWPLVQRRLSAIVAAVEATAPGSYVTVDCAPGASLS